MSDYLLKEDHDGFYEMRFESGRSIKFKQGLRIDQGYVNLLAIEFLDEKHILPLPEIFKQNWSVKMELNDEDFDRLMEMIDNGELETARFH